MDSDQRLKLALQSVRFALGGTAFVAGADKFLNLLTDWEQYLGPIARRNLPISERNFMRLVGVVEMVVGASILKGNTRIGGYVAAAWLLGITGNLISSGKYFDIAARDLNMAVEAFVLATLTEATQAVSVREQNQQIRQAA